jgi:hypothetical protein
MTASGLRPRPRAESILAIAQRKLTIFKAALAFMSRIVKNFTN